MDGNWISPLRTVPAASATPGAYDDISLLLAHTQLDGFVYQSFREAGTRIAGPAPAASAHGLASWAIATPVKSVSDSEQPAKIAGAVPIKSKPFASAAKRSATSDACAGAAFSTLFDRLVGKAAPALPERPLLELHLPSRPVAPRAATVREELSSLPTQRAFARLRDAAPLRVARAG